jgi:two-component system chemotaxis response regulator CheB
MRRIKVLVVDDSPVMRKALTVAIARDSALEIVGTAAHGRMAIEMAARFRPDVITLDIEMPVMDGLEALREIRRTDMRTPVIMFSSHTQRGARATVVALTLGATDYVGKPAETDSVEAAFKCLEAELLPKIKLHGERMVQRAQAMASAAMQVESRPRHPTVRRSRVKVVCVGVSTGGPNALMRLFKDLATPLPVPVLIVQHMPAAFTKLLADRLSSAASVTFHEAADGQKLENGHGYFAPGGRHMEVASEGTDTFVRLHDEPPENSCRPSVDVLFRSAARTFGRGVLAVVLTGMGRDGLRGCESVREHGGVVLAQDESSSVVWGMPGAVVEAGLADAVLRLDDMAAEVARLAGLRPVKPSIGATNTTAQG